MTIYTKKGDRGQTGLLGDRRLPKSDPIFEVLGGLDQCNALTGQAVSLMNPVEDKVLIELLEDMQRNFLGIGSCVASVKPAEAEIVTKLPDQIKLLEEKIDEWDEILPPLRNFILPGGSQAGAVLHVARTFVRQTERDFNRLAKEGAPEVVGQYLNRLSDFYFQAARYYNFTQNQAEKIWK